MQSLKRRLQLLSRSTRVSVGGDGWRRAAPERGLLASGSAARGRLAMLPTRTPQDGGTLWNFDGQEVGR